MIQIQLSKKHVAESLYYIEMLRRAPYVEVPLTYFIEYLKAAFHSYYKDIVYDEYGTWDVFFVKVTENLDLSKPIQFRFNKDAGCLEYTFQPKRT